MQDLNLYTWICLIACFSENLLADYYIPINPEEAFRTLWEIKEGQQLAIGGLQSFLQAAIEADKKKTDTDARIYKLEETRQLMVNLRKFIVKFMAERNSFLWKFLMSITNNKTSGPYFAKQGWFLLWNAIRNVDIQKSWNMWNPYYIDGVQNPFTSDKKPIDIELPDYEWIPRVYLENKYIKDLQTLMIFNLVLCEYDGYENLCPDSCLGKLDPVNQVHIPGNPCVEKNNTKSLECYINIKWSDRLKSFWNQMEDPLVRLAPTAPMNPFKWIIEDNGYACDCLHIYGWNEANMICDPNMGFSVDRCDLVTLHPCVLPGAKSCQTNKITGEAICSCHPRYSGTFCQSLYNQCDEQSINFTRIVGKTTISSLESGNDMCLVNMSGLPTVSILVNTDVVTDGIKKPQLLSVPKHSLCMTKPGSTEYYCKCEYPFGEDLSLKYPNCFLQTGSCNDKLCLHGTCITTPNQKGKAVCLCYPGYDGIRCDKTMDHWSTWSECQPVCGRSRKRFRKRLNFINDNSAITEHAINTELIQEEECPFRLGSSCPTGFIKSNKSHHINNSSNHDASPSHDFNVPLLQLQAFSGVIFLVLIFIIQIIRCISFMIIKY